MKKMLAIIPLTYMLACTGGNNSQSGLSSIDQDNQYGASVITLPKVTLAKASTEKLLFDLIISGPGMTDMHNSWILGGSDTQATITRIPPGDIRIFTGTLTSSIDGVTHVGIDTVTIIAGKTAYVNLLLRKTGSAVVNVHIEETRQPGMSGCYILSGILDTISLDGLKLQVISDSLSPQILSVVMNGKVGVCKIQGPQPSPNELVTWTVSADKMYMIKVFGNQYSFSGRAYSFADTTRVVGTITGKKGLCDTTVVPPPQPTLMTGCYTFEGNIDTTKLLNMKVRILSSTTTMISGLIEQNGKTIGKVQGPQPSATKMVSWHLNLDYPSILSFVLKVSTDPALSVFKSIAFNENDTTRSIGTAWGTKTRCDTTIIVPQNCVTDTMGDPTSCKDMGTWEKYAAATCAETGKTLSWISPLDPCNSSISATKTYMYVCFECCKK